MKKRTKYFIKQKLMGVALILLGVITAVILEGDITVALLLAPFGLGMIFTKKEVLLDDYYYEVNEDRRNGKF